MSKERSREGGRQAGCTCHSMIHDAIRRLVTVLVSSQTYDSLVNAKRKCFSSVGILARCCPVACLVCRVCVECVYIAEMWGKVYVQITAYVHTYVRGQVGVNRLPSQLVDQPINRSSSQVAQDVRTVSRDGRQVHVWSKGEGGTNNGKPRG